MTAKHNDSEGRHKPPKLWTMKFCPQCGRNDLGNRLEARHFSQNKLCHGRLITVKYKREE